MGEYTQTTTSMQSTVGYTPIKGFPKITFKSISGIQITIGILCFIIGMIEIGQSVQGIWKCEEREWREEEWRMREDEWRDEQRFERREFGQAMDNTVGREWYPGQDVPEGLTDYSRYTDDIPCEMQGSIYAFVATGYSFVSFFFIITGSLGVCAARTIKAHRQSGLKTGFIVMNILQAIFFTPFVLCAGVATIVITPIFIHKDDYWTPHMATGGCIVTLGFIQFILSIVSASISCSCAPVVEEMKVLAVAQPASFYPPTIPQLQTSDNDKAALVENEVIEPPKEPETIPENQSEA